jgi:PPOX class probable F420-dependent enzyme
MWFAWSPRGVYVVTHATAGKLKRIAHTDTVTMAPCNSRGRVRAGEEHGVAVLVPTNEQRRVAKAIAHRYLLPAPLLEFEMRRRGRGAPPVYLEIVIVEGEESAR